MSTAPSATGLSDCNKNCTKKSQKKYWCDLQNPAGPKCTEGNASKFHVNKTVGYCGDTAICQVAQLARCNATSGKCEPCKEGSTGCVEKANCNIDCKKIKPHGLNGTYRAIEISKAFTRGEFDFTFRSDNSVDMMYHPADDVSAGAKWELAAGDANAITALAHTDTPGATIEFTVKKASSSSSAVVNSQLEAMGFSLKVGDKLKGVYATKDGENHVTAFMYMALSLPNAAAATDFDDGMSKIEFNMAACKDASVCDFSSSSVAPLAVAAAPKIMFE